MGGVVVFEGTLITTSGSNYIRVVPHPRNIREFGKCCSDLGRMTTVLN